VTCISFWAIAAEQSAVAYIEGLYAEAQQQPLELPKVRYSPRLDRLWADCEKSAEAADAICMDFDMLVMGQDVKLSDLKIEQQAGDTPKALIRASFKNFGEAHTVTFDLIHDDKGWMIDEVRSGCYILSDMLQDKSTC
jgi:hypothetical protein